MANFNKFNGDVVSGVEHAKKGKGGLIAGITAGAVAVVAGGGIIAYNTSDYVKNQVKLAVSSPENYYTWVNTKNSEDFAKQISDEYRTSLDEMKNGQKGSVSLKYELSDSVKDMLSEGSDESVIEIIKNVNDISIGSVFDSNGTVTSGNVFAEMNGERLATFDTAVDSANMEVFFRISELTEQWLNVSTESTYGMSDNEVMDAYEKFAQDPESLITPDELETEINKYANLWNECIADVKLEKKADVAISDINVNYTVTSVEIDEAKANEIAVKFVTAVKEDDILKGIVVDKLNAVTADEYNSELDDILSDIENDTDSSSTDTVTLSTYIDPTGCIRGVSFETSDNDSAKFIVGKDGDEIRGEFTVSENAGNIFSGILTATENDKKYTGSFDMSADDETISVEFADLETVDEKKGYINGVLTFVLPADTEIPPVSVNLSSDGSSQKISADLDINGTDYGKITLDISSESGAEPSLPDKSSAFVIDENTDAEFSDYVEQAKMEEFITNILTKIGFTSEDVAKFTKSLSEELYYDYSADFDYSDFDTDFSYDGNDELTDLDIDDSEPVGEWQTDDNDDEIDDSANDYTDPYEADIVTPKDSQAYLVVMDDNFTAMYMGMGFGDTLSYNATLADITGNGTYTVKVTSDTDGYRNITQNIKPSGLMILGVEIDGLTGIENAAIEVKSVKIDGNEMTVTGTSYSEIVDNSIMGIIYSEADTEEDGYRIIDGDSVGEWTDIEVTFEVKGME